jgi:hypothetical protein
MKGDARELRRETVNDETDSGFTIENLEQEKRLRESVGDFVVLKTI